MTGAIVVLAVVAAVLVVLVGFALRSAGIDSRLEEQGKIPGPPAPSDESI